MHAHEARDLRDEFLAWLTSTYSDRAPSKRAPGTHRLTANHAHALLMRYANGGAEALGAMLDEAAEAYLTPSVGKTRDDEAAEPHATTAYQRLAAWREFLAFMVCTGQESQRAEPLPRFAATDTAVGGLLAQAGPLTRALRCLAAWFPPHTLANLTVDQALRIAEGEPDLCGAFVVVLRWGYLAGTTFYGTAKDYTGMPFLPASPGQRTRMKPGYIADAVGRVPADPVPRGSIVVPNDPLFVRRDGVILGVRRPGIEQPYPSKKFITAALSEERKARAKLRPLAQPRPEKPVKVGLEVWPPQDDAPRTAAQAPSKFSLMVNVAGVPALGAETLRDVFPVTVNLAGVKGYGEDGMDDEERLARQILTVSEMPAPTAVDLFDPPAF